MELASSFEVYACTVPTRLRLLIVLLHPHHLVSSGLLIPGKNSISNLGVSPFQCPGSRAHSFLCKLRNGQHQRAALQHADNSETYLQKQNFTDSPKHWTDALLDLRKSSMSNSKHREFLRPVLKVWGVKQGPLTPRK